MTLGLSSSKAIKIKTDSPKGLRAVECACCDPCASITGVCFNGGEGEGWKSGGVGSSSECINNFFTCGGNNPTSFVGKGGYTPMLCNGVQYALFISCNGSSCCFGIIGTWFFCKTDGIDSPIGQYGGYAYTTSGYIYLTFNVTEKQEGVQC